MTTINGDILECSVSEDFSSGVNLGTLHREILAEIKAQSLNTKLGSILIDDDVCTIELALLDSNIKTYIDDIIASHSGSTFNTKFIASSSLVPLEANITESSWQVLGGVVTNIGYFVGDTSQVIGRLVGGSKVVGTADSEIRLVENDGNSDVVMHTTTWVLPPGDENVWGNIIFTTDIVPRSGPCTYRLEGKLVNADSAKVRFVSLSMLQKIN